MQRYLSWILLGIIVLFALAVYTDLPGTHRFPIVNRPVAVQQGLDLKGGVRVLLCANKHQTVTPAAMSAARDVIENRASGFSGLSSPQISVVNTSCIDAELPGIRNQNQAISLIGQTGNLVLGNSGVQRSGGGVPPGQGQKVQLVTCPPNVWTCKGAPDATSKPPKVVVVVPGRDVNPNSANVTFDSTGAPQVNYTLNSKGASIWSSFTSSHVNTYSPVVLDGVVKSDPYIAGAIPNGQTQVTGLSAGEASSLQTLLNYGALPIALHREGVQTVSATLGPEYVHKAEIAFAVGVILVALFMLLYYRLPGLLADMALLIYASVVFALFKLIPVTLTLPAIAGFILSIGMAVDANVLIFERMKEELRAGKTLGAAIDSGFNRAWTSIRDSNVSTMITTVILYWFGQHFGTTIITGFAATLFIGVAVSMFTAIFVTRTFLRVLVASGRLRSLWLYGLPEARPAEVAAVGGSVA